MKTIFIFQTSRGFGKGFTLKEAIDNYRKANRRFNPVSDLYSLLVFKGKKFEDVGVDMLNWSVQNGATLVAQG